MEQDLEFKDYDGDNEILSEPHYDFSYKLSRKYRYEDTKETFYFLSEDSDGDEIELCTDVNLAYRVVPGSFSVSAPSDYDYFGYQELIAWTVGETTEYSSGDVVDPEKVLTQEEFQRYTTGLQEFISGFE